MALPVFPDLRRNGQGINITKTPMHSTRVAKHVSGREVRVPLYAQTIYQFELTFNVLASGGSFAYTAVGANANKHILWDQNYSVDGFAFLHSLQPAFNCFSLSLHVSRLPIGKSIGYIRPALNSLLGYAEAADKRRLHLPSLS
jgi:hypothetical protein